MQFFELFEKYPDFTLIFNGRTFIVDDKEYDNRHSLSDFIPFNITIPSGFFYYRFSGKYGSYVDTTRRTYFREVDELCETFILRALKGARNER